MNIRHYLSKVVAIAAIAVMAAANPCFGTVLGVNLHNQEQDQWCWDASSQMLLEFFGTSVSQTEIANWAVGGQNVPNWLWDPPASYGYKGCDEVLDHFGSVGTARVEDALSLSSYTSEIDAGHPFMIQWNWTSGGGHAVVGYGTEGDTCYVQDPWPGNDTTIQSYSYVYNARNQGQWTRTLKTTGSSHQEDSDYLAYLEAAQYYLDLYYSSGDPEALANYYYYYALAGYYYYASYGYDSYAAAWYYYYMTYAYVVMGDYCFELYNYYGSNVYAAYGFYYYAYAYYYYYTYLGNSYYANYYYNFYMYYANWYYSH